MSLQARLLNTWLRRVEKPAMARATDPVKLRQRFEWNARMFFYAPGGTRRQWQVLDHGNRRLDALEVMPRRINSDAVILYFHGGGFVFGSPRTHAALLGQLTARLGMRALLPRYRLAPEAPFPAAFDDVRMAWDTLLASGIAPDRIVVGGDSAGGALALALLGHLVRDGAALPAGVFCFSPLTDMTFSGASFVENAETEAILPADRAGDLAEMYLDGQDPTDPRISPLFADFAGAPPVWLTAGSTEILRDDSRRMAQRLKDQGVEVTYVEENDLPHVWPFFHNSLPEARHSLDQLAVWIRQVLARQAES